jgi:hypothetical protein
MNEEEQSWGQYPVRKDLVKVADENSAGSSGGEVRRASSVLFEPGSVVELRAFKGPRTVSGYFDDHEALAEEAAKLDSRRFAVYVTLNEVKPALLARAASRAREVGKGEAFSKG